MRMYKIQTKLVLYRLVYFLPIRMPGIGAHSYQSIFLLIVSLRMYKLCFFAWERQKSVLLCTENSRMFF